MAGQIQAMLRLVVSKVSGRRGDGLTETTPEQNHKRSGGSVSPKLKCKFATVKPVRLNEMGATEEPANDQGWCVNSTSKVNAIRVTAGVVLTTKVGVGNPTEEEPTPALTSTNYERKNPTSTTAPY